VGLFWCDGDEDENLERVGSLERVQPTFLLIETLRHRRRGRFGVSGVEVRERRLRSGVAVAGRGKTLGR
jgi:hypothetical protein